jgi:phosphatidylserine decarboxylase
MNKDNILYNYINYSLEIIILSIIFISIALYFKNKYLICISGTFLFFILFFFRNFPVYKYSKNDNININGIISPSSSKIIMIKEKKTHNFIKTYLSPLDEHILVSPINGKILNIESNPTKNDAERMRITLQDDNGNIMHFDQIVSIFGRWGWMTKVLIDKRVIISSKIGDTLKQGERYGIIRFGSNMEYFLPKEYQIKARIGEKCELGESVIAMLKN